MKNRFLFSAVILSVTVTACNKSGNPYPETADFASLEQAVLTIGFGFN